MVELSLVDTPANPLANVMLVHKVDGVIEEAVTIKGDLETIYMCREDNVVKVSKDNDTNCPVCNCAMSDIGFVESNDTEKAIYYWKHGFQIPLEKTKQRRRKEMAEQNETDVVESLRLSKRKSLLTSLLRRLRMLSRLKSLLPKR